MDNLPNELQEIINKYSVTDCVTLMDLRNVNRKYRELIDNNIDRVYGTLSIGNPDLSPIDFTGKNKLQKRQAVINACRDEERKRVLRLGVNHHIEWIEQGYEVYDNYKKLKKNGIDDHYLSKYGSDGSLSTIMKEGLGSREIDKVIKIVKDMRRKGWRLTKELLKPENKNNEEIISEIYELIGTAASRTEGKRAIDKYNDTHEVDHAVEWGILHPGAE